MAAPDEIRMGVILMATGTVLPKAMVLETTAYSSGWESVQKLDPSQLDKKIGDAGWTFFYLGHRIKETAFGFSRESALEKAMLRVISQVREQQYNCLQVTEIAAKSFLHVSSVTVSAHSRQIQESMCLTE